MHFEEPNPNIPSLLDGRLKVTSVLHSILGGVDDGGREGSCEKSKQ